MRGLSEIWELRKSCNVNNASSSLARVSTETVSAGGEKAKTRSSCGAENNSLEESASTESLGVFEGNTGVRGKSRVSKS